MAAPEFVKISQSQLKGWDWVTKQDQPFTKLQFCEGTDLNRHTAGGYLRGFCRDGVLKESPQHPCKVYTLLPDWDKTPVAERFRAAYYYS